MTAPDDVIQMLTDAVFGLRQQLADLERRVAASAAGGGQEPPPEDDDTNRPPPNPRWFRQRATPEDWDDLTAWVEDVREHASLGQNAMIPACWVQHPGLVEDLAALYQSWRHAMLSQDAGMRSGPRRTQPGRGSQDSSIWFTQSFWPTLRRRDEYQCMSCANSAHVNET